jgi:pyrroloquinoline quinone biosynthesis protein B
MSRLVLFLTALLLATRLGRAEQQIDIYVLGIAQDGGLPHLGCTQERCERARRDPSRRLHVSSLGIVDRGSGRSFLLDATPDLEAQVSSLRRAAALPAPAGRNPVDGILLTHAHIGHYLGLALLGREAAATQGLPLWSTQRMADFLRHNGPWKLLVDLEQVELQPVEPGSTVALTESLRAEPLLVPHRDEFSDTVAWLLSAHGRRILYLPDIDKWRKWQIDVRGLLATVDLAFIDGTFFDAGELPGRNLSEIPHPTIRESLALLGPRARPSRPQVYFIHLNHTNPALDEGSAARQEILAAGFGVAREGERFSFAK